MLSRRAFFRAIPMLPVIFAGLKEGEPRRESWLSKDEMTQLLTISIYGRSELKPSRRVS